MIGNGGFKMNKTILCVFMLLASAFILVGCSQTKDTTPAATEPVVAEPIDTTPAATEPVATENPTVTQVTEKPVAQDNKLVSDDNPQGRPEVMVSTTVLGLDESKLIAKLHADEIKDHSLFVMTTSSNLVMHYGLVAGPISWKIYGPSYEDVMYLIVHNNILYKAVTIGTNKSVTLITDNGEKDNTLASAESESEIDKSNAILADPIIAVGLEMLPHIVNPEGAKCNEGYSYNSTSGKCYFKCKGKTPFWDGKNCVKTKP